jgi:hypothetical protein
VLCSRAEVEQALRVSRNSAELLQEMLAPIKTSSDKSGLQETFVTDLADQCYRSGAIGYGKGLLVGYGCRA